MPPTAMKQLSCRSFLISLFIFSSCLAVRSGEAKTLSFHYQTQPGHHTVFLASNLNQWNTLQTPLLQVAPGEYHLELEAPWLPALEYKFVVDGQWLTDPLNPKQSPDGVGGWNSAKDTGFIEDPLLELQPGTAPQRLLQWSVPIDSSQKKGRTLYASVPSDLRKQLQSEQRAVLFLYFQDGKDYLSKAGVAALLANLNRESALPLLIGIFLPPVDRMNEYGLTPKTEEYGKLLTETIIPFIERTLTPKSTSSAQIRRALIGPSLGGLVTLYLGLKYSHLFSAAGSQSGSFWFKPALIENLIQNHPGPRPRLWLDVGTYETESMMGFNRKVRDQLLSSGYKIRYEEAPSLHDWTAWRNRLQTMIRFLAQEQ